MVHDGGREDLRQERGQASWCISIATLAIAGLLVLANGCAAGASRRRAPATEPFEGAGHETLEGVYTEEQSRRGETIYFATCAPCHRAELTGSQIVPPLSGDAFLERWGRRTAGDLFEKVRTMPPIPTPNPPTRKEYADVLAYILSKNRFPAGRRELADDYEALTSIRIGADE